jgi:DNA recombination protein RmuC
LVFMSYNVYMELIFLVILLAVIIVGFISVFFIFRGMRSHKEIESASISFLQNQINEMTRTLDFKLGESTKMMQRQFGESARIVRDVTDRLAKLDSTNQQVMNFAGQLENLQNILKNPKHRGVLGEYFLETVLQNTLPPNAYQMQYSFKDGDIVDAAIFIKDKIIPIDSKFSLENYNRILGAESESDRKKMEDALRVDLKLRIDETSKYIRPKENTMDFSFMFIPSEGLYYDLLINKVGSIQAKDLIEYAFSKKVIIVSPTSFFAYLQTVLQGLRALRIEESAKEIRKRVEELGRHLSSYEIYMQKMGTHLGTTVNMYNSAYKEFGKIDKDVMRISGEGVGSEPLTLEKPKEAE